MRHRKLAPKVFEGRSDDNPKLPYHKKPWLLLPLCQRTNPKTDEANAEAKFCGFLGHNIPAEDNSTECRAATEIQDRGAFSPGHKSNLQRKGRNKSKNNWHLWADIDSLCCLLFLCLIWTNSRCTPAPRVQISPRVR